MKQENQFKHRLVIPALKQLPNCWFFINESFISIRGLPDIVGVVNGRFFAWELKHGKKEALLTTGRIAMQLWILQKIRNAGGIGELVHPENLEECLEELRKLCNN